MKRLRLMVAMMLVLSGMTACAIANDISVFGGSPFPHAHSNGGEYGQRSGGWEAGASYSMPIKKGLDFYVEGGYHQLPNAVTYKWLSSMKVLEGSANLKIRTCDRHALKPYVLLGVGLADISFLIDTGVTHVTMSSTEFAIRGGGGFDYITGKKWNLFIEGLLYETINLDMIPVRAGIRLPL